MGSSDPLPVDEAMEGGEPSTRGNHAANAPHRFGYYQVVVAFVAALIFGISVASPPSLMDDVDAVQAQIARNMLQSGDWVTARLDGIAYLEKSPLKYWLIAISFRLFGTHDWAARIPLALGTVLLCWVTARFAAWAFGPRAGLYAGLVLATCVGLFLFTRILIPDALLTLVIVLAMWSLLRALEEDEPRCCISASRGNWGCQRPGRASGPFRELFFCWRLRRRGTFLLLFGTLPIWISRCIASGDPTMDSSGSIS